MRHILASLLLITACRTPMQPPQTPEPAAVPPTSQESNVGEDPYLWLEEVDGERALAWVAEQNERTARSLASDPLFEELYGQALSILDSESRVPRLTFRGEHLYNLWRSSEHPRGIYRRTTLAELKSGTPRWETVLDIDQLAKSEGKPWVFSSMTCLSPENRQCLVSLSPGGGDAVEIREFDTKELRFVSEGFHLPLAKTNVGWIDADSIFVGTDFGDGTVTGSGYARIVKRWTRGTPLSSAVVVHEGRPDSVSVSAQRIRTTTSDIDLVNESKTTWSSERYELLNGQLHRLALPESALLSGGFQGSLVIRLTEPWTFGERAMKSGSVIVVDPAVLRGEAGKLEVLAEPDVDSTIESVTVMDDAILVTRLENVRGRLIRYTPAAHGWSREVIAFPDNGAISVMTTRGSTGDALVQFESFVTPPTLFHAKPSSRQPEMVLSQQATFDGSRISVTQNWAVSKDGTRIPYFVVGRSDLRADGKTPVHIFSYGGFRVSLTPAYSGSYEEHYGAYGKLWLERGGVFVLANIRGGGEFGPEWHSTVLRENRHKVFEDFEAIAGDLVARGTTRPELIGIEGRSNGGLLTLGTMIRRSDLYGAVISGVPLSDMKRYHRMLAGASWVAEYGNPEIPEEWSFLKEYSPYQNFRAEAAYPPLFVYTSTRDDRVHPAHARKTVARLQELGHEVWYYENTEGGHGGSS
ncbi:MAG TPA: prolyl oligopeptidase family serine peptidase, partial [Thermoanaerobaculia bacterium]